MIKVKEKLTPKQEFFCELYANDVTCFGNATLAYAKAYGLEVQNKQQYGVAKANGSRLLTNANIFARTNQLMDLTIKKEVVQNELVFVIMQRYNLAAKVAAIREYNNHFGTPNGDQLPIPILIKCVKYE